jgi:serine/threonine protein kinase/class 3 adenylate cyclase
MNCRTIATSMMRTEDNVDELLKARAEIDEQLRRHKNSLTVLFTDVVGSTSYFERNGDTAGLVMIHRHDELAARAIEQNNGRLVKTIGDSAMAEFAEPKSAVRAAVEIERQFHQLNLTLAENKRVDVRIGIHTGVGFRKGNDLFGDVVNVTARIVKRTAPAQILISRPMYEAISQDSDLQCRWLSRLTIDGRTEKEDIFEVMWTDAEAYRDVQDKVAGGSPIPPRYEVLSQIGTGGTGIVYKVRDLETTEIVALKILKPEIASDPEVQENFKRELLLARKITHKNVCRIHEFSRSNGTACTSMEFVEGESLLSRLYRTKSLPLNEALDIARQICAGLREAHAQGIIHRDLKPANIMVDRNGTVKIMDFGIARMAQREGPMTGRIVGTPAYMAPEQAELKPVSPCTDIYALGLVLYEMITGVPAFSGDTPVAVALKQIREYPKRPREIMPQLSAPIDAAIMKCLQKDSAKRFQSVDEFEIALQRAAKAKRVSPWEVSVNRGLQRAEIEIRKGLRKGTESAQNFVKQQDWVNAMQHQQEPKARLGITGLIAALTIFVLFGGWKNRSANAQPIQPAASNSPALVATGNGSSSGFMTTVSTQNSFSPIASTEVDLYGASSAIPAPTASSDPGSPADNFSSSSGKLKTSAKASPVLKHAKVAARADGQNIQSVSKVPAQSLTPSIPAQPETPGLSEATQSTASEPVDNSSQLKTVAEPTVAQTGTTGQSKTAADSTKTPELYFEVGSFKDETWASSAVDKLEQLGFHAVMIHKTLLWSQSYHVQVGPYSTQKDIAAARESLTSQGFKTHPTN